MQHRLIFPGGVNMKKLINLTQGPCLDLTKKTIFAMLWLSVIGCAPTVKVAVPDKPIEINLNIKIEHEIKVKVDEELNDLFDEDNGLF